jgi:hypothetical protein
MRALYASTKRGGAIMNRVRALASARERLQQLKAQWAEMSTSLPKPMLINSTQQSYGLILDSNSTRVMNEIFDLTQAIRQMEEEAYSALGVEEHGQ